MKKKLLAILLTLAMVVTMLPAAFVTVTAEDGDVNLYPDNTVVEVGTAAEWKSNVKAGVNIKLTADITLKGAPLSTFYNGLIDGNGHTITVNYVIGADDTSFTPTQWPKIGGLFTRLYGCTIKDLTVAGTVSLAKDVTTSDKDPLEIGGIAGTVDGTATFVNVKSTVNVTVTNETNLVAGGFFGYTSRNGTSTQCNTSPKVTMKNCVYDGTVSVQGGYAGGFIGKNISTTTLTNCVAKGTVTANKTAARVGGILGWAAVATDGSMTMESCENQAAVKDGIYMGGMIAYLDTNDSIICNTTLRACVNKGDIVSELPTSSGWPSVGGMIGDTGWGKCDLDVVDCVNYGKVYSLNNNGGIMGSSKIDDVLTDGDYTLKNCANFGDVSGSSQAAGIVQYLAQTTMRIENCVNYADLTKTGKIAGIVLGANKVNKLELVGCVNYGKLSATETVGAILTRGYDACKEITLDGCVNYGDITVTTTGNHCVGGLIGQVGDTAATEKLVVKNSANFGTVSTLNSYVGGIAGALHAVKLAQFENCYNYGTVYNTATASSETGVAGIINRLDDEIDLDITGCHNFGKLSTNVWGWTKAGGILATAQDSKKVMKVDITGCSNFGVIEIYNYSGRTSDNTYSPEIGGIAGTCSGMAKDSTFNITKCYTNGVVVESDAAVTTRTKDHTDWKYSLGTISAIATDAGATTKTVSNCASAYKLASGTVTAKFSAITGENNVEIAADTDLAEVVVTLGAAFILDDGRIEPKYDLNNTATQVYATQEATAGDGETVDVRVLALVNSLKYKKAGVRLYLVGDTEAKAEQTTTTVYTGVLDGEDTLNSPYGTYYLPITLKGISNKGTYSFVVETFVVDGENEIAGEQYTITVTDGAVAAAKKN